MSPRAKNIITALLTVLAGFGIVMWLLGHGGIGLCSLVAAGVGLGIWGPPGPDGPMIHGSGDST